MFFKSVWLDHTHSRCRHPNLLRYISFPPILIFFVLVHTFICLLSTLLNLPTYFHAFILYSFLVSWGFLGGNEMKHGRKALDRDIFFQHRTQNAL
ncbi:hypothetical protein V8F33_000882 [Rhypophila sp. PSN 637]